MRPAVDITDRRFGRLRVIAGGLYQMPNGKKRRYWACVCDCGVTLSARHDQLLAGKYSSCGCSKGLIHGHTGTPEHKAWCNMIERCHTSTHQDYINYGARGITVCNKWRTSFTDFLADVGKRPSPKYSIDRYPDNNGNYEPHNVRWATRKEQQRNMRSNRIVIIDGAPMPLAVAAERFGVDYQLAFNRLRRGWPIERVLGVQL